MSLFHAAHIPVWCIVLPFLAGVLVMICADRMRSVVGTLSAFLVTAVATGSALRVFRDGSARYALGGWGIPLGIELRLDGVSAVMVVLTSVIGLAVVVYAGGYLRRKEGPQGRIDSLFWSLVLFLWGGLHALFLSADIFNLYVSLELLTLAAVALIALAGTPAAVAAALRYLLLALAASLLYLLGVGIVYSTYGQLDLAALATRVQPDLATSLAVTLMTLGLLTKAALFPMHVWLPPAHARAPAPVSALLSGLVVVAPLYLLLRLWFGAFGAVVTPAAAQCVGVLGSAAVLWGGFLALRQERLKMVLAYSTVSQLGYMFLLFPLAVGQGDALAFAWNGGLFFAVSHACAKASVFLAAGTLLLALGHDRVRDLRGTAERYPLLVMAFAISGVNLMGLPPSGGFVAKWMLVKSALDGGQWGYAVVIVVGSLLAAAYVFRVIEQTLVRAPEEAPRVTLLPALQWTPLVLALCAAGLGLVCAVPLTLFEWGAPLPAGPVDASTLLEAARPWGGIP